MVPFTTLGRTLILSIGMANFSWQFRIGNIIWSDHVEEFDNTVRYPGVHGMIGGPTMGSSNNFGGMNLKILNTHMYVCRQVPW